jgi:hypothetical protein
MAAANFATDNVRRSFSLKAKRSEKEVKAKWTNRSETKIKEEAK